MFGSQIYEFIARLLTNLAANCGPFALVENQRLDNGLYGMFGLQHGISICNGRFERTV
ncbi:MULTISPECIES: hypothetical protein [Desulfococcus]|uniref:Uncharacterized protein n=1 Tax=Desulfococcus multivorans DSM 2059 TaxID=1121405 RepID=S7TC99_DESML|nr:hypothetical protein [Desulfococcus multivorans]EPR34822.1 hypothetical protein dsmv_3201 [Desulfococcus multivorans DSM 2059]MDX9819232.1 hypothetical protein [Desulfococcus multivorans]SJZ96078.1 hypothetical protein SAMN02745446_02211 [Desulfococcus multivorans DSM 2059]